MKTKKYEVEIMSTTYRIYYITAESQEKAEEMAFDEMDADWEISKVWKQNAEISFLEEIREEGDVPKSGSNKIVSDWHEECEEK